MREAEGFELEARGSWGSVDGRVDLRRDVLGGVWNIAGRLPSDRAALRHAGVSFFTAFPTRKAALEAATAILGSDPCWCYRHLYYLVRSGAAPGVTWVVGRGADGAWHLDRYDPSTSAARVAVGAGYPSRRAALVDLRRIIARSSTDR